MEIQQELGIGRTSFYKMKKQALGYLGFYFYEIVVPQAKDKRFKPSLGVEEELSLIHICKNRNEGFH